RRIAAAASWSFTENRHACTAIMLRSTPHQPGHAAGLPDDRRSTERKKAAVPRHGGQHAPAHWHARFTRASTFSRTPPSWPRASVVCLFSGLNFLIRRSQLQILLLHNGRELVEIF